MGKENLANINKEKNCLSKFGFTNWELVSPQKFYAKFKRGNKGL